MKKLFIFLLLAIVVISGFCMTALASDVVVIFPTRENTYVQMYLDDAGLIYGIDPSDLPKYTLADTDNIGASSTLAGVKDALVTNEAKYDFVAGVIQIDDRLEFIGQSAVKFVRIEPTEKFYELLSFEKLRNSEELKRIIAYGKEWARPLLDSTLLKAQIAGYDMVIVGHRVEKYQATKHVLVARYYIDAKNYLGVFFNLEKSYFTLCKADKDDKTTGFLSGGGGGQIPTDGYTPPEKIIPTQSPVGPTPTPPPGKRAVPVATPFAETTGSNDDGGYGISPLISLIVDPVDDGDGGGNTNPLNQNPLDGGVVVPPPAPGGNPLNGGDGSGGGSGNPLNGGGGSGGGSGNPLNGGGSGGGSGSGNPLNGGGSGNPISGGGSGSGSGTGGNPLNGGSGSGSGGYSENPLNNSSYYGGNYYGYYGYYGNGYGSGGYSGGSSSGGGGYSGGSSGGSGSSGGGGYGGNPLNGSNGGGGYGSNPLG